MKSPQMIKPATTRDFDLVFSLMQEYFEYDAIPWNSRIRRGLKLLLENRALGQVFLIHVGQEIAGYTVVTRGFDLEFGGVFGLITDLYIRAQFRRLGLGTKTIEYLLKVCKVQNMRSIELQVQKHNKKACRFYQKLGFVSYERVLLSKSTEIKK